MSTSPGQVLNANTACQSPCVSLSHNWAAVRMDNRKPEPTPANTEDDEHVDLLYQHVLLTIECCASKIIEFAGGSWRIKHVVLRAFLASFTYEWLRNQDYICLKRDKCRGFAATFFKILRFT